RIGFLGILVRRVDVLRTMLFTSTSDGGPSRGSRSGRRETCSPSRRGSRGRSPALARWRGGSAGPRIPERSPLTHPGDLAPLVRLRPWTTFPPRPLIGAGETAE